MQRSSGKAYAGHSTEGTAGVGLPKKKKEGQKALPVFDPMSNLGSILRDAL
jgi:hypothetical protein